VPRSARPARGAAYGTSSGFGDALRSDGLDFAVAVNATTGVRLPDAKERRRGAAIGVQKLGIEIGPQAFRRVTWRTDTRGKLASRFCFRRVEQAHDDGSDPKNREALWLVLEWPYDEKKPTKFALTTLPCRMSKKQIVRTLMAVHQKVPRHWTADEVGLVRLVVDRCWEAIERMRAARGVRERDERSTMRSGYRASGSGAAIRGWTSCSGTTG
jgi:hypothetical protein